MASIKSMSSGRKDLYSFDPSVIQVKDGWNVRADTPELREHIESLALSIAEIGVQEPLTVYTEDDNIYLSNGHCRLSAVFIAINELDAEIKSIPCRVEERYSNEADRTLAMITRNSGLPLTLLEKSKVIKKLLSFGWEKTEIACKIGTTVQTVNRALDLQAMPEDMKKMVNDGQVSASLALDEVKQQGSEKATAEIKAAVSKDPSKKVTKSKLRAKVNKEMKALKIVMNAMKRFKINNIDGLMDLEVLLTEEMGNGDNSED